jgi:galactose-1-phosphate uridylyltransferase
LPSAILLLYLATSPTTVSVVVVEEKEHENKLKQFPVYFVLEALSGAKLNYSDLEKIAYTVAMAS